MKNQTDLPSQPSGTPDPAIRPQRKKFNFWRYFWLTFLVVSLAWAWHAFYAPPNKIAWFKSYAAAQQESVQTGKPTILFFTGTWCSPCRIMKREVWADQQVEDIVNAQFAAVTIDVDDPQASATLSRYKVGSTPTTIVVDPQGDVLERVVGRVDKESFLEMLSKTNVAAAQPSS